MAAATRYLELTLLSERFAISRLDAGSSIPTWATQGPFFSITRTGDELSIVSELSRVPVGVQSQPGWRVLKVHGPFVLSEIGVLAKKRVHELSGRAGPAGTARLRERARVRGPFVLSEIGVLAALATPLAEAKISLFAISTFDTDYLLIASEKTK